MIVIGGQKGRQAMRRFAARQIKMMVYSTLILPEGYIPLFGIDLQKNKRLALLVNLAALLIAAVMIVPALFLMPISQLFSMSSGLVLYFLRFVVLLAGIVIYMVLHELIHGLFIKFFSGVRASYGFTGLYAYAGSEAYFHKKSYLIIALAPVVILGMILLAVNFLVPDSWFWVVYFIQVCNLSGAAGDFYVVGRFAGLPENVLVQDTGVSMTVYGQDSSITEKS